MYLEADVKSAGSRETEYKVNKDDCIDVGSFSWDTGFNIWVRTLWKNANMLGECNGWLIVK